MVKVSIIAAVGKEREIGTQNRLPWHGKMRADMARFKEITSSHIVIMGRMTYESIGRPLPNRINVIITSSPEYIVPDGCIVFNSLEEAINTLSVNCEEIFIIGGSQIYEQALPIANRMYITQIDETYPEADKFFPVYSLDEWEAIHKEDVPQDDKNFASSTYIIYKRKCESVID